MTNCKHIQPKPSGNTLENTKNGQGIYTVKELYTSQGCFNCREVYNCRLISLLENKIN